MQINTAIRTARDKGGSTGLGCSQPASSPSSLEIPENPAEHTGTWEDTSSRAQQIRIRPWMPLRHSLENPNSSSACLVLLAWSPTNMHLNLSSPFVSHVLGSPFLSFPSTLFSPHTRFYLNLTSQRRPCLPLSQMLVNHVIGSSSESALNQCSSRVFLELPFLTCHKTKAPITQSH